MIQQKMYGILVVGVILINTICGQQIVGTPCTLRKTKSPGTCKPVTECKEIQDEIMFSQREAQTCGFQSSRSQMVVCCPITRQPGYISRQKCREYSPLMFDMTHCGHNIVKRLAGGDLANSKEFPHMAAIGFKDGSKDVEWRCGGSLISEQYVLTTAQCSRQYNTSKPAVVLLGVINLKDSSTKQEINITDVIFHPKYKDSSYYHDIALLRLEKSVKIDPFVRPACLYTDSHLVTKDGVATGWGATHFAGNTSNDLRKVTLKIVDHEFCNQSYSKNLRKLENGVRDDIQFCTGRGTEEKDTCAGDGGGPLQISHHGDSVYCMYDIIGLSSFGKIHCNGGPSVFTRVSYYVKWIEDIVWPEKN